MQKSRKEESRIEEKSKRRNIKNRNVEKQKRRRLEKQNSRKKKFFFLIRKSRKCGRSRKV